MTDSFDLIDSKDFWNEIWRKVEDEMSANYLAIDVLYRMVAFQAKQIEELKQQLANKQDVKHQPFPY